MAGKGVALRAPSFRDMNLDFWIKEFLELFSGEGRKKEGRGRGIWGRF